MKLPLHLPTFGKLELLSFIFALSVSRALPEASAFQQKAFVTFPMRNVGTGTGRSVSLSIALDPTSLSGISERVEDCPVDNSYLRWKRDGGTWEMQTAVTTFRKGDTTIDLHAQLHFGDDDYFEFYNRPEFSEDLDHVFYELLVDEDLLERTARENVWRLRAPIMASPNDQNLGKTYNWECQASKIDYTQPKWIHADMSRQEFLKLADSSNDSSSSSAGNIPLWKAASPNPQSSSAAAEAVSALLVGPPQLSSSRYLEIRPESQLVNILRTMLWLTVPTPELSVILLDWSNIFSTNRKRMTKATTNPSAWSDVAWPIFSSLAKLDIKSIRRFMFGQILLSSNSGSQGVDKGHAWSLLVTRRNDHALKILRSTLNCEENSKTCSAVLFGSSHCPDLHSKLLSEGFAPVKTTWRTAWSVQESEDYSAIFPTVVALLIGYLAVGALDWVGVMGDIARAWNPAEESIWDAGMASSFYLARHVLLYLGFSKFLIDWTNNNKD